MTRSDRSLRLSVAMITFNEARRVERTLAAAAGWADEIVVVDSGSRDGTQEICRHYGARVIERGWPGFGKQKNVALDACQGEWILAIDADEVVTPALREEIDAELRRPCYRLYRVPFEQVTFGKVLRHSPWHLQLRPRLSRHDSGRWSNDAIHETLLSEHEAGNLSQCVRHYTYLDVDHYRRKVNIYRRLEAEASFERGRKPRRAYAVARGIYNFLRSYVGYRGFLDGTIGLQLAWLSSFHYIEVERHLARLYANRTRSP